MLARRGANGHRTEGYSANRTIEIAEQHVADDDTVLFVDQGSNVVMGDAQCVD